MPKLDEPSGEHSSSARTPDRFGRDLRRYASQTTIRLLAGMIILLLIIGNGLILLLYGEGAVRASLLCMLVFFMPVILISLLLALAGWVSKRGKDD